jgi:hypothetical protein
MCVFIMFIHMLRSFMIYDSGTSFTLPSAIGFGQSGTGPGFSPSISVPPPLSITPPVLLIGISFTYHQTDTILASDSIIT